ncbi:MAG: MFS transporter [Proteobacteria bacterium]|nr:MFS transporter [Pseudomonadota bacterium]
MNQLRPAAPSTALALAAAVVVNLPLGSLYAFSVFLAPLEKLLGASRSELASVFSISVVFFTIGMNMVPRLFGRIALPLLLALATGIAAAGVMVAALAQSFPVLAAGYGVLFASGGGMAYVAAQQAVNVLPLKRPGLVNGFIVSLFPLGAMIAAPLFGWGIAQAGVRATLAGLAVATALAGLIGAVLATFSGVRLSTAGGGDASGGGQTRYGRIFWLLAATFVLAATAGLMVLSQAAAILQSYGNERELAIAATTGITAAIAAARLTGGVLIDLLPVPAVAAGGHLVALAGGVLLTLAPSPLMAIPTLAMIGIGYGIVSGLAAGSVALFWEKPMYGTIAGRVYVAWCLAALTLPVVAAHLFDMTGGYRSAIMLAAAANLTGIAVGSSLPRQEPRR